MAFLFFSLPAQLHKAQALFREGMRNNALWIKVKVRANCAWIERISYLTMYVSFIYLHVRFFAVCHGEALFALEPFFFVCWAKLSLPPVGFGHDRVSKDLRRVQPGGRSEERGIAIYFLWYCLMSWEVYTTILCPFSPLSPLASSWEANR